MKYMKASDIHSDNDKITKLSELSMHVATVTRFKNIHHFKLLCQIAADPSQYPWWYFNNDPATKTLNTVENRFTVLSEDGDTPPLAKRRPVAAEDNYKMILTAAGADLMSSLVYTPIILFNVAGKMTELSITAKQLYVIAKSSPFRGVSADALLEMGKDPGGDNSKDVFPNMSAVKRVTSDINGRYIKTVLNDPYGEPLDSPLYTITPKGWVILRSLLGILG